MPMPMRTSSRRSVLLPLGLCAAVWGLLSCSQGPPAVVDEPAREAPASILVEDAWSRPAPGGANGAVYLTLVNRSAETDRLLAARSPDAKATELHEVVMEGDRMRMALVEGGLEVPAGGTLELAPAGHHLMVIGLVRGLAVGDQLALVLELERAGEIDLSVPIVMNPRTGG